MKIRVNNEALITFGLLILIFAVLTFLAGEKASTLKKFKYYKDHQLTSTVYLEQAKLHL